MITAAAVAIGGAAGALLAQLTARTRLMRMTTLCAACFALGAASIAGLSPLAAAFLGSGLCTALAPMITVIETNRIRDTAALRNLILRNIGAVAVAAILGTASSMAGFLAVAAIRMS